MPGSLAISMNVSPGDLGDVEFVRALLDAACSLQPHVLGVEITERMLLSDDRIGVTLAGLRSQGIKVYVDDFGIGLLVVGISQGSLSLDYLKIPREFVSDIEQDSRTLAVVQGVVALGRALGLQAVAEGVETLEQARLAKEAGAVLGQGYLFDKLITMEQFRARVTEISLRAVA